MTETAARARFRWIHGRRTDLLWYIGSALAGWIYVSCVLAFGSGLEDPMREPFFRLQIGSWTLPLTLGLVVVASWAVLFDAPHLWATLARTWLDPDEWDRRRGVLIGSLLFFGLGPVAVFGPYMLSAVVPMSPGTADLGAELFFVFFRLWAYFHVVRQHWGFFALYKRVNDDWSDPTENKVDLWFFNVALYLPVVIFASAPWYLQTGMPDLYLRTPIVGSISLGTVVHPLSMLLYLGSVVGYVSFQWREHQRGRPRNAPKLLLLAAIVPLHLVVFLHPLLALFVVPVVTIGHNLQYHRIVWAYGRNKYLARAEPRFRWARLAFRSAPIYFALGLGFTLAFYRGPWVSAVQQFLARGFDSYVMDGIGLVAGVVRPAGTDVGARVVATLFLGWAMQHYYLDAKIWRVRRDPGLRSNLHV